MTSFYVHTWKDPGSPLIEISETHYRQVLEAKSKLLCVVSIEEKFDLLIQNYLEFECEALVMAQRHVVELRGSYSAGQFERQHLNRRLSNLLSATRLYIDQVNHSLASMNPDLLTPLESKRREQYGDKLGYRVMETVRNYTQHQELPVHNLYISSTAENIGSQEYSVSRAIPMLDVAEFAKYDRMSASGRLAAKELERYGREVAITPLVREHVEGLGAVHEEFRQLVAPDIPGWERDFASAWKWVNQQLGTSYKSVFLVQHDTDGQTHHENVFEELLVHRAALARKNREFAGLSRRFAAGSVL